MMAIPLQAFAALLPSLASAFARLQGTAPVLASVAIRGAWESAVIAGCLALLLRWLPGLSAKACFQVCSAAFALAAVLPVCQPAGIAALRAAAGLHQGVAGLPGVVSIGPGSLRLPVIALAAGWAAAVCGLWAFASAVALVRLAAGAWALRALLRSATPAPAAMEAVYRQVASGRRAGRARLLVADGITSPSACGLFGATVVLPRTLVDHLSFEELAGVLRHEAAHLRRWDDALAVLARLVQAALPLAFALPYLERQMARAREMACDDAALTPGVSPRSYAACLARLAEHAGSPRWRRLAPGFGDDGSQLALRIGHILRFGQAVRGPGSLRLASAGVAGLLLSAALLCAPAVCSFRGAPVPASVTARTLGGATLVDAAYRPARWRRLQGAPALPAELEPQPVRKNTAPPRPRRSVWAAASRSQQARVQSLLEAAPATSPSVEARPPMPDPGVLVLWTGRHSCTEQNLILLVARPQNGSAPAWSDVFLLTL